MTDINLKEFAEEIDRFYNIKRKLILFPIMEQVRNNSFHSELVFKGMGEDAAALFPNPEDDENLVLLTTDSINEEFCKDAPWSAGFSAIMVGIEDISACGGIPIGASVSISSDKWEIRDKMMQGILEASKKFQIPIVRGHTADESKIVSVSASIMGYTTKDNYISAGNAQVDDSIVIVADFDGRCGKTNKYYWDTMTFKSTTQIIQKRQFMIELGKKHFANASKDISNGGLFGTLLLMLQYSEKGAIIDISKIEVPESLIKEGWNVLEFSKMYLTSAFLLSVDPKNIQNIKSLAEKFKLNAFVCGKITEGTELMLQNQKETTKLWDWHKNN